MIETKKVLDTSALVKKPDNNVKIIEIENNRLHITGLTTNQPLH